MPADPMADSWLDREAGPVVRPYAVTQGRVAPTGGEIDMMAFVVATSAPSWRYSWMASLYRPACSSCWAFAQSG